MEQDKRDWKSPAYESPARLLTLIILSIVFAEFLLAIARPYFIQQPSWLESLVHSSLLIAALFPILYSFWLRPLTLQKSELRRERIQSSIYRISETVLSAPNLEQMLRSIHRIINELMPARNFYIALYDTVTEMISFPYFADEKEPERPPRKAGKGLVEYVLKSGQPLSASREKLDELTKSGQVVRLGTPALIWLGVPLKTKDKITGVLVVQAYESRTRFRDDALEILQFVSTQVALAIERKRTEEALRESEERYKAFVQRSSEGIWRSELDKPLPITIPEDEQIQHIFQNAYIAECNEAMAKMYGMSRPEELVGKRIQDLLIFSKTVFPPGK